MNPRSCQAFILTQNLTQVADPLSMAGAVRAGHCSCTLPPHGFTPETASGGLCRSVWWLEVQPPAWTQWTCSQLSVTPQTRSLCQRKKKALGVKAQILMSPAMVSLLPWAQVSESSETLAGALLASSTDMNWPQGSVPALLSMLLLMGRKADILLASSYDHTPFCT